MSMSQDVKFYIVHQCLIIIDETACSLSYERMHHLHP